MSTTRFSIIITSYNQREFIKDAVDSALGQRAAEKEIIVVDDASMDQSHEVLRQYGDAIRLVSLETNQGVGAARNLGASLATGDYLVFLDGDDAFLPWTLEVLGRIIQARKPTLILGDVWWVKDRLPALRAEDVPGTIRIYQYPDYLRKDRPFTKALSKAIERQAFQGTPGWATDYPVSEDMDFILRVGTCGPAVLILEPFTIFYRRHAANDLKRQCLPPWIQGLGKMIDNERSGKYPGGKRRSFERKAYIGGQVLIWAEEAAEAGLYREAINLLARGWPMALAAVMRKVRVRLRGRQEAETLDMPVEWASGGNNPELTDALERAIQREMS